MTFSSPSTIAKLLRMLAPALLAVLPSAWANDPARWRDASEPDSETKPGSVFGRVVDDRTGVFLAGATVSLAWQPWLNRGAAANRSVAAFSARSREHGDFQFERIPTGVYAVTAELPGYLKSGMGAAPETVTASPGGRNRGLVVRLHPESVIQGRVLYADGRGAAGARVRAFAVFQGSLREIASGSASESGEFTVGRLLPGRYILLAEPPVLPLTWAPVFYPSSPTADGAVPIDVGPGDRASGIRIATLREQARCVRGNIDDFRGVLGYRDAAVYLVPRGGRGMDLSALAHSAPVEADRSFEFNGVPPGVYTIQLVQEGPDPRILAAQAAVVGAADVIGLNLRPEPPVSLQGRARVAGAAGRDMSSIRVTFLGVPSAAGFAMSIDALAGRDGRFLARNLEPASYLLRVQTPRDLYVERVLFGGREIADRALDLSAGAQGRLEIALRDGAARITGDVSATELPAQPGGARVAILYPAGSDPASGGRRIVSVAGDSFAFDGLPPGKYKVFATDRFDPYLFAEPTFLMQVTGAVRSVDLRRYDRKRLDLRLLDAERVEAAARRAGFAGF